MLAKLVIACWLSGTCVFPSQEPSIVATPAHYQQRTIVKEKNLDPIREEQILSWISQTWGVPYEEVALDYLKDEILISPSPLQTFWKIHYRGGCGIVDLADLL